MRTCTPWLLALALGLPAAAADAPETAAKVAAQKKKAEADWQALEAGPAATLETKHLLIYAPKALEKRLKAAGPLLEKHYELAASALGIDPKEGPWPGKLAVYLFPEREPFGAFVRRVEKQRLLPGQTTAYSAEGDEPHAAAMPSPKAGPPLEGQAGSAVAQALLARKAGKDTPLPAWLVAGFGRATYYRAAPADKVVQAERRQARALSRTRGPADVWGGRLDAAEAEVLGGSLADFLAYGPGSPKFPAFVAGFKPEDNMQAKTAAQALDAAGLAPERVTASWKRWVNR